MMKKHRRPFCLVVGLLLTSLRPVLAQTQHNRPGELNLIQEDLDAFFRQQLETCHLVGLSAGVIKNGKIQWSNGFGFADLETKKPVSDRTLFNVGSISKTVTLATFMHLWEKRGLNLDDDINLFLPFKIRNPKHPDHPITFRMLLNHTSSISDLPPGGGRRFEELFEDRDSDMSLEDLIKSCLVPGGRFHTEGVFSSSTPGEKYEYSNIGLSLVGYLIETLSGKPFTAYCRDNILSPLHMDKSTWRLSDVDPDEFALQYVLDPSDPERRVKVPPSTWAGYPDGGLRTSIAEFGNFLLMMMNAGQFSGQRVLESSAVEAMLTLQKDCGYRSRSWKTLGMALIWGKVVVNGAEIYQMNGFGPSFFAQVYFDPARKTGGMFFTTGQFQSFDVMGTFVNQSVSKLVEAAEKIPVEPD